MAGGAYFLTYMPKKPSPAKSDPEVIALVKSATLKGKRYFRNAVEIQLAAEIQALYPEVTTSMCSVIVRQILNRPIAKQKNPEPKPRQPRQRPQERSEAATDVDSEPSNDLNAKEAQSRQPHRYELLRQHSRGSGRCSWQVWDDRAHCVVHVADSGRSALEFIDELVEADKGFKIGYKYGKPVTINNDE
jgi:hypothetical protein